MMEATANDAKVSTLVFPESAMVGSVADFARVKAAGTEVPAEFYFAAGLTYMGALVGKDLSLDIGIEVDPRLYTVLLGESYEVRKSTAAKQTNDFFTSLKPPGKFAVPGGDRFAVLEGCGSAEGLARWLSRDPNTLLHYDEMQTFVEKAGITSSTLLQAITTLFERGSLDNQLKDQKQSFSVRGARLSLLGCCTSDTWSGMWTSKALNIGMVNRLFIVTADRKQKVAWPAKTDEVKLDAVRQRIETQLANLPLKLGIERDAKDSWDEWYLGQPANSPHAKRLDTIGLRLLALLALTTDKQRVDLEVVEVVRRIMDYELSVRRVTDPIDAENAIAQLEESIRRQLLAHGPLDYRELYRRTSANRKGVWMFKAALKNLDGVGDIGQQADQRYRLLGVAAAT